MLATRNPPFRYGYDHHHEGEGVPRHWETWQEIGWGPGQVARRTRGQVREQVKEVKEKEETKSEGGVTKTVRTRTSTTATIYIEGDVEKSLVAEQIKTEGDLLFD
ncbi:hypothetical protein PG997_011559 [Apiospora hydei]|uniref:Hypervirulence associated protein TUDOR domain-containing protein n=1 Tax=Apiospora hydei TaxID=1337664 RepID=A0ABR1VJD5_9PEZI